MNIRDIKPEDELTVFDKPRRKIRERQGKYVSANNSFLTVQFAYYKDSFLLTDLRQGKTTVFKDKEAVEFVTVK